MSRNKVIICPYCGDTQPLADRCRSCMGLFEPLSRQATHNAMGPWFVRNPNRLFQPGCSYETLVRMIERGQVIKHTIVRGPTTRQFWTIAKRVPGIAHLLGYCHNCDASVDPGDHGCHACGVPFGAYLDRNFLGLPDVKPLPWEAPVIERQQESRSSRSINWQRAAEPVGLSSFASDEDLRDPGAQPVVAAGGGAFSGEPDSSDVRGSLVASARSPLSSGAASALLAERAAPSARPTETQPFDSSIAMRSMRRRLESQQRTIRTLIVGLLIVCVVGIVIVSAVLSSQAKTNAVESTGGQATPSAIPVPAAKSQPTPPVISETPATQPTQEEIDFHATRVESDLQRVDDLIAAASQPDRPAAECVEDLQKAKQILTAIRDEVPVDLQPADLAERIRHIDSEIDRLRLKEFFP